MRMNELIGKPVIEKLERSINHTSLNYLLENKEDPFAQSQLVAAAKQIPDIPMKHLLTLLLSEKVVSEMDFSIIPPCKPENVMKLTAELLDAVQLSKAIQTGFVYVEKKDSYFFNANLFAEYFLSRVTIAVNEHGFIFAYSKEGVYKFLSDVAMGRLVRLLMNEGRPNSWRKRYENEAIDAIKRECFSSTEMDSTSDYINMKNGMYSLEEGVLKPHHPNYLSTVQIPIEYDAKATCPKFMKFMNEITCEDKQQIAVHQELMGNFLCSKIMCQKACFFTGWGANGKSVLAKVISILVGEQNVSSISLSQFSADFGLEGIIGKTVNISSENEMRGLPLNTEVFKAMVSGDGMTINIKNRSALTNYKMKCKFLFLTNQLPNTQDYTNGYFRRIMIIPFKRTFSEEEQNRYLIEELKEELPGIFNWAIEGLKRLKAQNYNFSYSQAIEDELTKYRLSQQPVQSFFDSMIELDEHAKVKRSDVLSLYSNWCDKQGLSSQAKRTPQKFYDEIYSLINSKYLPIQTKRIQGYEYFKGMKIKAI